jgi:hypothetical protein
MHFLGRKIIFLSLKFFFLKSWKINFYEYPKKNYERQNFLSEIVNLVLREEGISCSYAFLGICEAIFRGRGLIFCVEPLITVYISLL